MYICPVVCFHRREDRVRLCRRRGLRPLERHTEGLRVLSNVPGASSAPFQLLLSPATASSWPTHTAPPRALLDTGWGLVSKAWNLPVLEGRRALLPFPHVRTPPQLHAGAPRLRSGASFLHRRPVVWPLDSWPADCGFPFCHLCIAFPFRPAACVCLTRRCTATQPQQTPEKGISLEKWQQTLLYMFIS